MQNNKIILCGSKPFKNINFDELVDSFEKIIRHNLCLHDDGYGKKKSTEQICNCHFKGHIYDHSEKINNYKKKLIEYGASKEKIERFFNFYNTTNKKILQYTYMQKFIFDDKYIVTYLRPMHFINIINKLIKNEKLQFKENENPRVGLRSIIYTINCPKQFLIGYSLDNNNLSLGWNARNKKEKEEQDRQVREEHSIEKEKKIIVYFHNKNKFDATFCALKDSPCPTLDCNLINPKVESINLILKTYGICILENYFDEKILNNIINEFHKIFENKKEKIKYLDSENLKGDPRIFNAELYSDVISKKFTENQFFLNIAQKYCNMYCNNRKTLINKVIYNENHETNSGGGWHRDDHDLQFKVIMYLSDVTEKNGCFNFITKSHKKFIGNPEPRTTDYSTRFTNEVIEKLLKTNNNCIKHNIIGKKGTIIIADTSYIHRGKVIEEGERYAITNYYI